MNTKWYILKKTGKVIGHIAYLMEKLFDYTKLYVMVNHVPSETIDVKFGVPQRSILGPLNLHLCFKGTLNPEIPM